MLDVTGEFVDDMRMQVVAATGALCMCVKLSVHQLGRVDARGALHALVNEATSCSLNAKRTTGNRRSRMLFVNNFGFCFSWALM